MEGLIFGGAYLRREICVSKSIGLALQLEVNLPFLLCFFFLHYWFGGLIFGGAYTWIGSFSEFYGSFLRSLDRNLMCTAEVGVKRRFNVPSYS